jgi:purine nucleosidase
MRVVAVLMLSFLFATSAVTQTPKTKVILDTDIGDDIDDAWALGFVIQYPGFEPLGVTAAHGDTAGRARIACKLLHAAGRDSIPVAVGRQTPGQPACQFSWAEDYEKTRPIETPAADFIVAAARRHPGEVVLIAVGPLENVADALRKEPKLGRLLKRVVLMSGCVYGTADTPSPKPEYNVYAAVADSQVVYGAGLPLTIVPLDSTTHVRLSDAERERVRRTR